MHQLTVFLFPTDAPHAVHDEVAVKVTRRDKRFAENSLGRLAHVSVIDRQVHLPSEMVREVKCVGWVSHGELVQPAVAQVNLSGRIHYLEGDLLRLFAEQTDTTTSRGASHVLGTFHLIGRRRIGENPVRYPLHSVLQTEPPPGLSKALELFPLPVLLESKASACSEEVEGGHRNT